MGTAVTIQSYLQLQLEGRKFQYTIILKKWLEITAAFFEGLSLADFTVFGSSSAEEDSTGTYAHIWQILGIP